MSVLLRRRSAQHQTTPVRAFQLLGPSGQVRNASLSAIHRGIRRSDRPGSQKDRERIPNAKTLIPESGGRRSRNQSAPEPKSDPFLDRFKDVIDDRQRHFKPKKALQKMQKQEEEGGRKSRSKRFNEPGYSFGKKSLVYQLNHGELKDKFDKLLVGEGGSGSQDSSSSRPGSAWKENFGRDAMRSSGKEDRHAARPKEGNFSQGGSAWKENSGRDSMRSSRKGDWRTARSKEVNFSKGSLSSRSGSAWRESFDRNDMRFSREDDGHTTRSTTVNRNSMRPVSKGAGRKLEDGAAPQTQGPRQADADVFTNESNDFPVAIQYTTAASQFLYGRSAVKAALSRSRRKLYKLYLYRGSNKKITTDDDSVVTLAKNENVKIHFVYEADQRLLDRMSKGRPHNGFVLEASPLPQLPLVNLGDYSTEIGGYTLSVARQSKEDMEINGSEGFIPCKPDQPRPLVLLLNEILDPGNLGAILRTARFLGASAVAITGRTSSTITSTVAKAAAGAAEELTVFKVEDPALFLRASGEAGWTSFAAVAPSLTSRSTRQWTLDTIENFNPLQKDPCILVLGNEGTGLPDYIRRRSTHEVTIPQTTSPSSLVDSLNVSVAAALLCNSFLRGVRPRDALTFSEKLQVDARKANSGETLF